MSIFVLRTQRMMQGPHGRFQTSNPNKTLKGPAQKNIRTKHNESVNARTKPSNKTSTTAPTKHTNKTKDRALEQNIRTNTPIKHPETRSGSRAWTSRRNAWTKQPNKTWPKVGKQIARTNRFKKMNKRNYRTKHRGMEPEHNKQTQKPNKASEQNMTRKHLENI